MSATPLDPADPEPSAVARAEWGAEATRAGEADMREGRALLGAQFEAMGLTPDHDGRDVPGPNALARMDTAALVGLALARCSLTSEQLVAALRTVGSSIGDVGRYSAEPAAMPFTIACGLAEILELRNPPLAPVAHALRARLEAVVPDALAHLRALLNLHLSARRAEALYLGAVDWLTQGPGFGYLTLGMNLQPPAAVTTFVRLLCLRALHIELAKDGVDVETLLTPSDREAYRAIS